MFGFMQQQHQQHQQHQQQAAPKPAPASSVGGGSGKLFDMKNLGAIMKVKSTGCKSCGG